jgi:hypothetical protein
LAKRDVISEISATSAAVKRRPPLQRQHRNKDRHQHHLSVPPAIFARTLGGTIMLKASIASKSSWLGCFSKQLCKKLRVAAMLLARSSENLGAAL